MIAKINNTQNNVSRQLDQIMDKLIILSNKTFFITPSINRAFGKSKSAITNAMNNFEQKKTTTGKKSQKEALQIINLSIQLLMDALNELKDSNSPSRIEQFMEAMQQMAEQQQALNQSTQKTMQMFGQGIPLSEILSELQSQQQKLKDQLGELQDQFGEDEGSEGSGPNEGPMEKIGEGMEEIIQNLENQDIESAIKQQKIVHQKMIDYKNSKTEKNLDKKRKSKKGGQFEYTGNKNLNDDLGHKNLELINAMESAMEEGFSIEYNKLIRNYFLNLQKENNE